MVPSLLGHAIVFPYVEQFELYKLLLSFVFTLSTLLYILLLNDWSDQKVDQIKRNMFPNLKSLKTIPDQIFSAQAIKKAGLASLILLVLLAFWGAIYWQRLGFFPATLLGAMLFQSYSFKPLSLNYRGGGEFLEMLGVGFLLPWLNAYLQSGFVWHDVYWIFTGFSMFSLASALASGLADEKSDQIGGKKTFVVLFSNGATRKAIAGAMIAAVVCMAFVTLRLNKVGFSLAFFWSLPAFLCYFYRMIRISHLAETNEFKSIAAYKNNLHLAIWSPTLILSLAIFIMEF